MSLFQFLTLWLDFSHSMSRSSITAVKSRCCNLSSISLLRDKISVRALHYNARPLTYLIATLPMGHISPLLNKIRALHLFKFQAILFCLYCSSYSCDHLRLTDVIIWNANCTFNEDLSKDGNNLLSKRILPTACIFMLATSMPLSVTRLKVSV